MPCANGHWPVFFASFQRLAPEDGLGSAHTTEFQLERAEHNRTIRPGNLVIEVLHIVYFQDFTSFA
jgi:hypothetical protein